MYNGGKGQVINRAEFLRWKYRDHKEVVIPIEASLTIYDPLGKWQDHKACWQMQYRGALGESLLHVLIICDTKVHTKLARVLLRVFPKLSLDVMEGEEYLGASALHLAIAYSNNELFLPPYDQQREKPAKNTEYEGLAYMGEYPLSWAACCANESVYNLLLDYGADPDMQDSFGNMILHMVVVCDKLDMFGYALRHPKTPARNGIPNNAGFTPLTLACQLGRAEVFREMLELSAKEFWRYSNITCSGYSLNALDTLLPDGRTNWASALFIILNGTKEEHLDMLDGGIIQRLLEEKWKTFAQNQFLKRLLIHVLHLLCLSVSIYMRPSKADLAAKETDELDGQTITRYLAETATILGVLSYVILQQGDEVKNQGLSAAIKLTGPFVTMIYSMITGDMFTFGIIYTIVLFGFCEAFYFLYKGHPQVDQTMFSSFPSTWMALFQITLGDYNYADLVNTTHPGLTKTVFITFMIFVPILLLNMLIAMMGNTYAHVIEQSEKEWMKQWAKIVVSLERAVSQEDAKKYLEAYSIPLAPSDDSGMEVRGVMVIKSKSKTRAKQRKGAVSNWKRVGRVTLQALKKRGMTGEEMRRLMWGRASISSPEKILKKKNMDPYNLDQANYPLGDALDMINFGQEMTTNIVTPTSVKDPMRDLFAEKDLPKKEIPTIPSLPAKPDQPAPPVGGEITGLSSLFQDPKEIVDPKKVEAFYKKLAEIDDTEDSDLGVLDKPILGKVAWIQRTRTTFSRVELLKQKHTFDGVDNPAFSGIITATEQYSEHGSGVESSSCPQGDEDDESEDHITTVEEVRRKMAEFHLRKRQPRQDEKARNRAKSARIRGSRSNIIPKENDPFEFEIRGIKSTIGLSFLLVRFITSINNNKQNVQNYLSHLCCLACAAAKPGLIAPLAYTAPVAAAPGVVTATSSQFVARTHNGIVAPVVAPVAAKIIAPAPLAYTAPIVKAPLAYSAPIVASAPIIKAAAPLAYTSPVAYSSPLVHSHLASPLTYSAPILF
uniref:Ion transport domain-containing protein n=1 Tax=Megaselia scalaris TaxID=36166 RepID=T1GKP7_MEGSC